MTLKSILTTTAAVTLIAGAAQAQAPAAKAPAPATAPAKAKTTPPAEAPVAGAETKAAAASDIVATAKAAGQFTTFLKAVDATNLTGLLKTTQDLTVFAPTDAAFAALPAGELDTLMLPENKAQLQKLLIYHLINARVTTETFRGATRKAATVAGPSVELSGGEDLKVNDADIVQADVMASNGVIHVIDKVLMPPGALAATTSARQASALASSPATAPAKQVMPKPKKN